MFNHGALTTIHVVLSLIGIGSGLIVMFGLLTAKRLDSLTALFPVSTVATSVTGFFFTFHGFTPGIGVGIISLVVLALAIIARYALKLGGAGRWLYVVTAMVALYLNAFVLIVQLYQKVPALKALAPKGNEPPFAITQLVAVIAFVVLTVLAVIKFRPAR